MQIPLFLQPSCEVSGQMINHFEGAFKAHKEVHGDTLSYKVGAYAVRLFIVLPLLLAGSATLLATAPIGFFVYAGLSIKQRSTVWLKDFVNEVVALIVFPFLTIGCVVLGQLPQAHRCHRGLGVGSLFDRLVDDLQDGTGEGALHLAREWIERGGSPETLLKRLGSTCCDYLWGYYHSLHRLTPIAMRLTPKQYGEILLSALTQHSSVAAWLWTIEPALLSKGSVELAEWVNIREDLRDLFAGVVSQSTLRLEHLEDKPILYKLCAAVPANANADITAAFEGRQRMELTFLHWLQQEGSPEHREKVLMLLQRVYSTVKSIQQGLPIVGSQEDLINQIDHLHPFTRFPSDLAKLVVSYLPPVVSIKIHAYPQIYLGRSLFLTLSSLGVHDVAFSSSIERKLADKICGSCLNNSKVKALLGALTIALYTLCEKFIILPIAACVGAVLSLAFAVGAIGFGLLIGSLTRSSDILGGGILVGFGALGIGLFAMGALPIHMAATTLHLQHAVRSATAVYARCMYTHNS